MIWITGASSGIGESLAYRCSIVGCKLILSARDVKALAEVRSKCLSLMPGGGRSDAVLVIPFDIKDLNKHEPAVRQALTHFGRIDILVNNAGRSQRAMYHEVDISVDQEMFAVNVMGPVNLSRIVLNHWYDTKRKGQFVVTSSTLGKMGIMNAASYAGTKHALHGYFESIRNEGHEKGISVTMLCPGPTFSRAAERAFTTSIHQTFDAVDDRSDRRMKTDRCSHLMMVGMANQVDEAWICQQPILSMYYIVQYFPTIGRWFIPRFMTRDRVSRLREGKVR